MGSDASGHIGRPPRFERRVAATALLASAPATAAALLVLWTTPHAASVRWPLTVVVVILWPLLAFAVRRSVVRPLQTIANMLAALRAGDFTAQGRGARADDALGLVLLELNALGTTLREQRLGALEATALLRVVIAEIDVAILVFDGAQQLRLVNRAGERLLAQPDARLLGRGATELGLATCLEGAPERTIDARFPGGAGRWGVLRSTVRQGGRSHHLLVISDLSRTLREEERLAWQRIIRVLGHEINNSLAPIKSIAESLQSLLARTPRPADWDSDLQQGLAVVAGRAESLRRFMSAYALLARLPAPERDRMDVGAWVERVARLETRVPVAVATGPALTIEADADQLDQLLINLVRNAGDAALETGGGVELGWARSDGAVCVWIRDEGTGLADSTNLFVPFFTTKPSGTGIGLALSRQIAEGHGGSVTLENRRDARGCEAMIRLPLAVRGGTA